MPIRFCDCKQCLKARRKGLVLGARWTQGWRFGFHQGTFQVSDYVPHPRFSKGKRVRRPQAEAFRQLAMDN